MRPTKPATPLQRVILFPATMLALGTWEWLSDGRIWATLIVTVLFVPIYLRWVRQWRETRPKVSGTSTWTALKLTLVLVFAGTERAVRYSDRLAAKGR